MWRPRFVLPTFILLTTVAFAQATATRVSPDEAAKHVVQSPKPAYPPLAQQARIEGSVILEVSIDETGAVRNIKLVRGHPMLAAPAIEAMKKWTYQPFDVDGKPAIVKTFVAVTFVGGPNPDADDRAEINFQDGFWRSEDSAEVALAKGDVAFAEQDLNKETELLSSDKDQRHLAERWQWMTTTGRLRMAQKKYDEAEDFYKRALALREKGEKDSPGIGVSMANLAALFAEEKKFDLARQDAEHSFAIFTDLFKKIGIGNPGAKQAYGQAAANESRLLLKLASARNDAADLVKQCRAILEFQEFLSASERDLVHSECQPAGHPSSQ
jgi:TonB family protein